MARESRRFLCALAASAAFAFGGVRSVASADDVKKPQPVPGEAVKKPAAEGDKPAAKPDGDKPKVKPGAKPDGTRTFGRLGKVNAATKTITILRKGDGGVREDEFKLADDVAVTFDGKPGKVDALKPDMMVEVVSAGEGKAITAVRATGQKVNGIVKSVTADTITIGGKVEDRTVKLAADGKVTLQGKDAKLSDIKAGDKVIIQLTADDSAALLVTDGAGAGDKPKPGAKPEKPGVKPAEKPGEKNPEGDKKPPVEK